MDSHRQFMLLGMKQLAIQEGIGILQQSKRELELAVGNAKVYATIAVIGRMLLIPANVVINAGGIGSAKLAMQSLNGAVGSIVEAMYRKHGASGSGLNSNIRSWEGIAKVSLNTIKTALAIELKRKSLQHYIPGANILIGLSEDSLALASAVSTVTAGNREMDAMKSRVQQQLNHALRELVALGILRNHHLHRMQTASRTA